MKREAFFKKITDQELKQIQRLGVRELEEESKGHFVAFVDDADNCFDVKLVFSGEDVIDHRCDCGTNKSVCIHRKAVMAELGQLIKKKVQKVKQVRKKKISPLQELIESQPQVKLQEWLFGYLSRNKSAEVEFSSAFSGQTNSWDEVSVQKSIDETFTAVIKRKRRDIPATDIKKIVDLLKLVLEPIEEFISFNLTKESGYRVFAIIAKTLNDYQLEIETNSTRLNTFVTDFGKRYVKMVLDLKTLEDFNCAFFPMWRKYFDPKQEINQQERFLMLSIYQQCGSERRIQVADLVRELILQYDLTSKLMEYDMVMNSMIILSDFGLFEELHQRYRPISLKSDYNFALVQRVVKFNQKLAIEMADLSIALSYTESENLRFYLMLEDFYKQEKDREKLINIRKKIFLVEPSLVRYKEIVQDLDDANGVLIFQNKIRKEFTGYYSLGKRVLVEIYVYEKDWRRLVSLLNNGINLSYFWPFRQDIIQVDKMMLLRCIHHYGRTFESEPDANNLALMSEIIAFLKDNYTKAEFFLVYSKYSFYYDAFNKTIEKGFLGS